MKRSDLDTDVRDALNAPPAPGYTKFHRRQHGYPISFRRVAHGQYELLERPLDYLVMYAQAVGDVARIAPIERLGTFGDTPGSARRRRSAPREQGASRAAVLSLIHI